MLGGRGLANAWAAQQGGIIGMGNRMAGTAAAPSSQRSPVELGHYFYGQPPRIKTFREELQAETNEWLAE